jgi:hypothetical protein
MFISTHGIIARPTNTPVSPWLLDNYTNAAVAYSVTRRLRNAYIGSLIRVRRSSDNMEQDISFLNDELDTVSMLDFVGYNMWTYSEEFNNAVYVKTNINTTGTPSYINIETAPDSTLTGDKIIENTTTGTHSFRISTGTIINGASYNISVYLKQSERTSVEIASQISGTLQTCILDLTNGAISSNGFANTPTVTSEANGWYRFSVTIISTVTTQATGLRVTLRNASNQTSYAGDNTSGVYVWGTQLSQTSTVETYQKTVATAGSNGFVTTWYDQSGNNKNATQTTAIRQPRIVSNGNLLLKNGKPNINFVNQMLNIGTTVNIASVSYITTVGNSSNIYASTSVGFWTYQSVPSSRPQIFMGAGSQGDVINVRFDAALTFSPSNTGFATNKIHTIISAPADTMSIYGNNTLVGTATKPVTSSLSVFSYSIGGYFATDSYRGGDCQEFIQWNNDKSTNRTDITTNINTFYSIY